MDAPPDGELVDAARPAAAQAEVTRLRLAVLSGRGPGASTSEFLRSTRARPRVGGLPVPLEREGVARAAAAARRDTDELALFVAAAQSIIGEDVGTIRVRHAADRERHRARATLRGLGRSRILRLTSVVGAALVGIRSQMRRRR